MNQILDMLMQAGGGGAAKQVGQRFGLNEEQTGSALGQLVPVLMAGLQKNAQQGGIDGLMSALQGGSHARYLDEPETLGQESTTQDGNAILGHILGSKDVSRAVASQASAQTGIGADVLKKMLPIVATMVMGGLSKQTSGGRASAAQAGGTGGLLTSLLDRDGDGSVIDDVGGMLGKFLGGR